MVGDENRAARPGARVAGPAHGLAESCARGSARKGGLSRAAKRARARVEGKGRGGMRPHHGIGVVEERRDGLGALLRISGVGAEPWLDLAFEGQRGVTTERDGESNACQVASPP